MSNLSVELLHGLLAKPIAELEALTDEELVAYFGPVLHITNPAAAVIDNQRLVEKPRKQSAKARRDSELAEVLRLAQQSLKLTTELQARESTNTDAMPES